jgi:hypothetical protein
LLPLRGFRTSHASNSAGEQAALACGLCAIVVLQSFRWSLWPV